MDWGSASPFSVGWWAVVGDECEVPNDGRVLPRGAIVRYREWYGASAPNVGLKLTAEQIADGIASREVGEKITYGVLDPAAFKEDGGPSWPERMQTRQRNVTFTRANNARVSGVGALDGWDTMRQRIVGTAKKRDSSEVDWSSGRPMLSVFSTCGVLIDRLRRRNTIQRSRKISTQTPKITRSMKLDMAACRGRGYGKRRNETEIGMTVIESRGGHHGTTIG